MTKIDLPYLMPGLNGTEGLMRQHYREAAKKRERLAWEIRSQKEEPTIYEPVPVTYIRHTARLMDWDNACASFKYIGDALTEAGIIGDDSPKIIAEFIPRQIKCRENEQRTEIIIGAKPCPGCRKLTHGLLDAVCDDCRQNIEAGRKARAKQKQTV